MKNYFKVVEKLLVKINGVEEIKFIDLEGNVCKTFDAKTNNHVAAKKSANKEKYYKEACTLLSITPKKGVGKPADVDSAKRAAAMAVAEAMVGGSEAFSDEAIPRLLKTTYPQFIFAR